MPKGTVLPCKCIRILRERAKEGVKKAKTFGEGRNHAGSDPAPFLSSDLTLKLVPLHVHAHTHSHTHALAQPHAYTHAYAWLPSHKHTLK